MGKFKILQTISQMRGTTHRDLFTQTFQRQSDMRREHEAYFTFLIYDAFNLIFCQHAVQVTGREMKKQFPPNLSSSF